MDIKRIIKEEIDDFDWVRDTQSFEEILDDRFRLVLSDDGYKFKELDLFGNGGWFDYERSGYTNLVKHKPTDLYKIVFGIKPKWFRKPNNDVDILNTLKTWKEDRLSGILKTYPNLKPLRGTSDAGPR